MSPKMVRRGARWQCRSADPGAAHSPEAPLQCQPLPAAMRGTGPKRLSPVRHAYRSPVGKTVTPMPAFNDVTATRRDILTADFDHADEAFYFIDEPNTVRANSAYADGQFSKDHRKMGFRCGIVGLPNVGKSTLFNALTETAAAQAANYPFCTIEPNVGEVAIPDARLEKLAKVAKSQQLVPARMSFVDIAGLVKGASKGEGLGNQFLANIRECDAVIYVLRCFEDGNIIHVAGKVDPLSDAEVVETEL
eukprot:gene40990-55399_t